MMDKEEFKQTRLEMGLTQEKMAERLGVCVRTVQRWEHGDTPVPGVVCKLVMLI